MGKLLNPYETLENPAAMCRQPELLSSACTDPAWPVSQGVLQFLQGMERGWIQIWCCSHQGIGGVWQGLGCAGSLSGVGVSISIGGAFALPLAERSLWMCMMSSKAALLVLAQKGPSWRGELIPGMRSKSILGAGGCPKTSKLGVLGAPLWQPPALGADPAQQDKGNPGKPPG